MALSCAERPVVGAGSQSRTHLLAVAALRAARGVCRNDDEAEEMEAALKMKAKLAANSPAAKKPPAKAAVEACIAGHC